MTAQAMSAGTAETRSGSGHQPASAVGTADAPNPLYQEGYSMTDTTDQQAVTVAQEAADWLRAISDWLLTHDHDMTLPSGTLDTDPLDLADRLASVSSASAETPAGMKTWLGSSSAPADWDGGPVLLRNGVSDRAPKYWSHASQNGASIAVFDVIAYTPAFPEPVPATNQAGEVEAARHYLGKHTLGFVLTNDERQEIARIMASFAANRPTTGQENDARAIIQDLLKAIPLYWAMSETDKSAVRAARSFVATQPATSQEGNRPEFPGSSIAATPTPPTLSEDLPKLKPGYPDYVDDPDGLDRFRQQVRRESGHDMAVCNNNSLGRLIDTIERLRAERDAALAQVKAS